MNEHTRAGGGTAASDGLQFDEVRIENTNRCGYRCFCCPRDELSRPLGVMPLDDFRLVLERVGPFRGSVDLHGFGEPLLDPALTERAAMARSAWPDATLRIITTLGVRMTPERIDALLRCGLSVVEVSMYGADRESYVTVHGADRYDLALENLLAMTERAATVPQAPQIVVRALGDGEGTPAPEAARPAAVTTLVARGAIHARPERALHNFGRGRVYNPTRPKVVCSVVWGYRRRVLQVTWDLFVIPCCFDFDAEIRLGNLRTQSLTQIFAGTTYRRFIDDHRQGTVDHYAPCRTCERCDRA